MPEQDDELPPWLGERMRRTTNELFRADWERGLDEEPQE